MSSEFRDILKKILKAIAELLKDFLFAVPKAIRNLFREISKRLKFSITFKTTAINTMHLISTLIFTSIIIAGSVIGLLVYQDQMQLNSDTDIIYDLIKEDKSIPENFITNYSKKNQIDITIFNKSNSIYFTTFSDKNSAIFYKGSQSFESGDSLQYGEVFSSKRAALTDDLYTIQAVKSIRQHEQILLIAAIIILMSDLFIILVSGINLSKTMKKMLRPIDNMTNTAKSISINALNKRIDVVHSHDELKDLAETFNEMLARLEKAYEQQNQFVSDASHELRTPISVIQGYANMLDRWGKDDRAVLDESVNAIKSESENMKGLVEKLLFLARTDKNTQKIEKQIFSLKELIDEVSRETKMIDNNHAFICDRNDEIMILADRALIKQALRIFIDNSIKYTPENGTITLNSIYLHPKVMITIQDNGIGISKEDLPKIFDRFYRCDKARTRQMGGTGLGLSIAKWIVGKHQGNIDVESQLQVGTKIIITLPVR